MASNFQRKLDEQFNRRLDDLLWMLPVVSFLFFVILVMAGACEEPRPCDRLEYELGLCEEVASGRR